MRKENTMEQHDSTEAPVCAACRTVPVSYLSLDLSEPVLGWERFLAERNIEIIEDVSGRPSIPRWALTKLLDEQREREARLAAEVAERAQKAARQTLIPAGVAAIEGGSAIESMMAGPGYTSLHDELGRPRPNFLVEELEAGQRHQLEEEEAVRRRKAAR
jgi:hypothetical protein